MRGLYFLEQKRAPVSGCGVVVGRGGQREGRRVRGEQSLGCAGGLALEIPREERKKPQGDLGGWEEVGAEIASLGNRKREAKGKGKPRKHFSMLCLRHRQP